MLPALKPAHYVCLILIVVMLCQYGGLGTYASTDNFKNRLHYNAERVYSLREKPATNRFDPLLIELKEVIKRARSKIKSEPEKGFSDIKKLSELKESLVAEHGKIQEQFAQLETSLKQKRLPGEILNRQAQSVREYETRYRELLARLDRIESTQSQITGWWGKLTGRNKEANWDGVLSEALNFLEQNTPRPVQSSFDSKNLPHRSLKTNQATAPKLTREEWLKAFPKHSVNSTSVPSSTAKTNVATTFFATTQPTPADLAETIEVKFTPEIHALATSLNRNPVKIFNWVRNNIEFVPTWGSIQGAQLCLENRGGNAFDTASLLIALLRYSGIPARYQMGTIDVPVEKFRNWAGGFSNTEAAASLFASGGVPSVVRRVNPTGQAITVRLEHVWVKAFVDYAPSGGAVHLQGDTWLDLDPSFKQYDFPAPVNLSQFVRVNDAQTFLNQMLAPASVNQNTGEIANMDLALIQSTLQPDEQAVFNYLSANFAQKSMREIIGDKSVAVREPSVVAMQLPYKVLARGMSFAEVPATLRHGLEISITDAAGAPQLSFTQSLPALAGSRIVLGYVPASEADRQAIASLIPSDPQQPLPRSIPTTFINLKPELKIDDLVVGAGSAWRMGTAQTLKLKFTSPTIETPAVINSICVGEIFAIAQDLQQVSPASLRNIAERFRQISAEVNAHPTNPNISMREIEYLLLNSMALGWFRQVDLLNRVTAQMFGVVSLRYPSAGMAFSDLQTESLFGVVHQVTFSGITMDVDRDLVVTLSKSGNADAVVHHGVVMGMMGSGLEASVPTQFLHRAGETGAFWIATTPALAIAQSLGDTTVALNSSNFSSVSSRLGLTIGEAQEVQDALNAGMIVMAHERQLRDLSGTQFLGRLQLDPQTGAGAYIIGGTNGGEMLTCLESGASTQRLVRDIAQGGLFDIGSAIVGAGHFGSPGGLAGAIISFMSLLMNLADNAQIYENATAQLGDSVKPLMGLIVLMAGLSILKEMIGMAGGLLGAVGVVAGAYLNTVSWAAFRMAEQLINRLIEVEAITRGYQIRPGCLSSTPLSLH